MSDGLNIGDAFLLSTPPNDKHLFVVVAPTQNGKYPDYNGFRGGL